MAMRGVGRGWVTLSWVCLALVGGGAGIYFTYFFKGGSPYSFRETLPGMVSSFGADARVVQILVSSDNVAYEVITRDGRLHKRVYNLQSSRVVGGGTGNTRKVENVVRNPTASERRRARVTLGELAPGVVDALYHRVNFPNQGSSATLTGETWVLQSGARAFDQYEARYDGTRLLQTQSKSTVFESKPPSRTTAHTATHSKAITRSSITVTSGGDAESGAVLRQKLSRLLACVQGAQGDGSRITACQQRYAPRP